MILYDVGALIYFYNFSLILLFIYFPIYFVYTMFFNIVQRTSFAFYFAQSYVYGIYNGYGFEEVYESM